MVKLFWELGVRSSDLLRARVATNAMFLVCGTAEPCALCANSDRGPGWIGRSLPLDPATSPIGSD